jgi:hypothetical protein
MMGRSHGCGTWAQQLGKRCSPGTLWPAHDSCAAPAGDPQEKNRACRSPMMQTPLLIVTMPP